MELSGYEKNTIKFGINIHKGEMKACHGLLFLVNTIPKVKARHFWQNYRQVIHSLQRTYVTSDKNTALRNWFYILFIFILLRVFDCYYRLSMICHALSLEILISWMCFFICRIFKCVYNFSYQIRYSPHHFSLRYLTNVIFNVIIFQCVK